ncbi:hypothetical protein GPECTOR_17g910 [Gonium pectorale]|uniref:cyclin-dependent kinase n=1 Tax=Gonium pectorale TaxID=33097 RepID=A0A150GKF8_GONPE|nr:hypothetical protein GPECTOR_17g910 [Gonium pectorale]|eukprot:KXZ50271.1 hypothetical protein GPECTOR_17g910 [Gonium pectorale]
MTGATAEFQQWEAVLKRREAELAQREVEVARQEVEMRLREAEAAQCREEAARWKEEAARCKEEAASHAAQAAACLDALQAQQSRHRQQSLAVHEVLSQLSSRVAELAEKVDEFDERLGETETVVARIEHHSGERGHDFLGLSQPDDPAPSLAEVPDAPLPVPLPLRSTPEASDKASGSLSGVRVLINAEDVSQPIANASIRQAWIEKQIDLARQFWYDGINFDYELPAQMGSEIARNYTLLVAETRRAFRHLNPHAQVSVDVPWAAFGNDGRDYDYVGLATAADLLFVMSYDMQAQVFSRCVAAANSPLPQVEKGLQQYMDLGIPPQKLVLGVAWYGYDYMCEADARGVSPDPRVDLCPIQPVEYRGCPCSDAAGMQRGFKDLMEVLRSGRNSTGLLWDSLAQSPHFNYVDEADHVHQVWFETPESLRLKYRLAADRGLRGVGSWNLGSLEHRSQGAPSAVSDTQRMWEAVEEFLGDLGSGSYGFVWKCQQRSSGRIVAVKGFKLAHKDKKFLDQAIREVRMLRAAGDHPNVVQLLEAFRSSTGRVYMVFEFVERCLSSELHKRFTCGLPAGQTRLVLWQLLAAVAHLHSKKMLHRDIKPGNLLMTAGGVLKLCDFGFARTTRVEPYKADRFSSYVVTRWYRSPEMLVSDLYSAASDVWSLGCTFAELATGRPLFPGNSSLDQLWRIMRCLGPLPPSQAERFAAAATAAGLPEAPAPPPRGKSLWQRLPELDPQLLEVVKACLKLDPAERPTAAQLMQMPYFFTIPKLILGTPLEQLYSEHVGVGATGHALRTTSGRAAMAAVASPASLASLPVCASAPVRSLGSSAIGLGEVIRSPGTQCYAAAGPTTGNVDVGGEGGGSGAGLVRPRPPSMLLSAVAASMLGEVQPPPGSASTTVPLVSPRDPHGLPHGRESDAGEDGARATETGRGCGRGGARSAPRSPAAPPGRELQRGDTGAKQADQQQAHGQHKREQEQDNEQDQAALRKRRATATAVPTNAAALVKAQDGRAASAGGSVAPGSRDAKAAAARGGMVIEVSGDELGALLSSDSILAAAVASRGAGAAAEGPTQAPQRPTVVDDSCYTAHAGPVSLGSIGARQNCSSGVHLDREQDRRSCAGLLAGDANGPVLAGGGAPGESGIVGRSRSTRAAASGGREVRAGLGPGIGLLDDDDDDELVSNGDGHVSEDDELMEYFAAGPRRVPAAIGAGAVAGGMRRAGSMRGHAGISPVRSGAPSAGGASDHGVARDPQRRGPSEGMHAGVQNVHHGLYGSSSRQRVSVGTSQGTGTGTGSKTGTRRVAALVLGSVGTVSLGRHAAVGGRRTSPSQQGSPSGSTKMRPTVEAFLPSQDASDPLPVLQSPSGAASQTVALPPQPPPMLQPADSAPPPVVLPRPSTTLGTTTSASAEVTAEPLGSLAHADVGHMGVPPMSLTASHSTTVGYALPPLLHSRVSLPASGYGPLGGPLTLMSAGHQRRTISRQGSTVFNQLMYDALPEIGTPGGAPEVPAATPPRRRAVMSGFTPCRAAAARAAATGVPAAAAMAAAMGEAMRSTMELSVAFSPIHVSRQNDMMSPDGEGPQHAGDGDGTAHPRGSATAAAAASARRYVQHHRRHGSSVMLSEADRQGYLPMSSSVAGTDAYMSYSVHAAGQRGPPHGPYHQAHPRAPSFAATSDTGMLLGSSAPNTMGFHSNHYPSHLQARAPRVAGETGASTAVPSGSSGGGQAFPVGTTVAVPIPGVTGRVPMAVGLSAAVAAASGSSGTSTSRGHAYPAMTPVTRSRLASGNMVRVSDNSAAQQRFHLAADDTSQSADLDGMGWNNLGMSPANGAAFPAQPQHAFPHAPPVPPPARARLGRWASGLIDSLPEDREVTGDWRSSAGTGPGQHVGPQEAVEGPIQAFGLYSQEWGLGGADGATMAATAAAAATAAGELRPTYSSDVPAGAVLTQYSSPHSGPWLHAGDSRANRAGAVGGGSGGDGSRHGGSEGSRHGGGEGSRHGVGAAGALLSRGSLRLRSGRSRPRLDPASSSSFGTGSLGTASTSEGELRGPPRPSGPTATPADGRWLPSVYGDGSATSAQPSTRAMESGAAAPHMPYSARAPEISVPSAPAAIGGHATKRGSKATGSGTEADGSRSSGTKWPRAKALLGGRLFSNLVKKFKEQTLDK